MKKITIYLLAILILVITSSSLFAQVTFRMKRPPLNQLRAADLWNASIINTGESFTAYIYGSMKNNEDGEMIATGQTMTFEVKKGTTNFKVSDLPKIPDVSYLAKDPKYKKSFMNTGGAPPGDYKICCELRRTDNTIAGEDCFDQKIAGGDAPRLISPGNEEQLKIDNPIFTWMHIKSPTSNQTYTLRIVELKGEQSPDEAIKRNKAFFEKEGISQTLFQYPSSAPKFEAGKKYAWFVKIGDLQSEFSIFDRWGNLIVSEENAFTCCISIEHHDGIDFFWKSNRNGPFVLKIVEIKGEQSPDEAIQKNPTHFEQKEIMGTKFHYPDSAPKLEDEKEYACIVKEEKSISPAFRFTLNDKICSMLQVKGEPITLEGNRCCFKLTLINKNSGKDNQPFGFNIILPPPISITGTSNIAAGWSQSPSKIPANTSTIGWESKKPFPGQEVNLVTVCASASASGTMYVKYEWLDNNKRVLCKDSIKVTCPGSEQPYRVDSVCATNIITNGNFILGNVPGVMPGGSVQNWVKAYGSPKVFNDPNDGCWDIGHIGLSGNKISGQAVMQVLNPGNKITQGKKYRFSIAVKYIAPNSGTDYVKIRLIAFNNNLPAGTNHPAPATNIAIVGVSSMIKECAGWTIVTFPVWTANKNFDKIAINAENNELTSISNAFIDNVQMCDVNDDDVNCNEIPLDAQGNPVIPAGLAPYVNTSCPPITEEINMETGNVNDLYGGNGTDTWYGDSPDPCGSVGGTIPDDVNKISCDDSLKALGINMTCEEFARLLDQKVEVKDNEINVTKILPITSNQNCGKFVPDPTLPFGGRDIIFVHGLKMDHLCDKQNDVPGADGLWPLNPSEFYPGGYFKQVAEKGWSDHIWNFLQNRNAGAPPTNRYLVVDYNCNQRLEFGVWAVLTQIRDAMQNGTGVVPSRKNKSKECFGKEYVIISHSTGGLLTDVMLSIMNLTVINPVFKGKWGDLGFMLNGCKTHVALHPALSGSNMAKIFVIGNTNILTSALLYKMSMKDACTDPGWVKPPAVMQSILIDLIPEYTQAKWGPFIATVPVDVLTVAGGQEESGVGGMVQNLMHRGLDDGVLSMDCQCGNPTPQLACPTTYTPYAPNKVFDMGIPVGRAIRYFYEQKNPGMQFNGGCIPFLSPTGMVQPVAVFQPNALARYPRHYSYIQSASDHLTGPRGFGADSHSPFDPNNANATSGYQLPNKYYPSGVGPNWEEVRVITNSYLYNSGLVNNAVSTMVNETVRGLNFSFTIWYPTFRNWRLKWVSKTFTFWVWKRKYHILRDAGTKTECDYVYEYILR